MKRDKITCKHENKRRFPDLWQARLAAKQSIIQTNVGALSVYECGKCKGFHLTSRTSITVDHIVTLEHLPEIAQLEALEIIRTGPVKSRANATSRDEKWIHSMCLKLETKGLIRRKELAASLLQWEVA